MKKIGLLFALLILASSNSAVFAWSANEAELSNNGFSPELTRLVNLQRSRMEYSESIKPVRSRFAQFWVNVYRNDILAPTYEFGQQVIKH